MPSVDLVHQISLGLAIGAERAINTPLMYAAYACLAGLLIFLAAMIYDRVTN